MEVKIGLIGCGTVGRGLLEILEKKRNHLKNTFDFEPKIVAISDLLKGSILVPDGIDIKKLFALLDGGGRIDQYYGEGNTAELLNPLDMIEQCEADIIAELTIPTSKRESRRPVISRKPCGRGCMSSLQTRGRQRCIIKSSAAGPKEQPSVPDRGDSHERYAGFQPFRGRLGRE